MWSIRSTAAVLCADLSRKSWNADDEFQFAKGALWPEVKDRRDRVLVHLWESYLERA